jgi:glycosyltransferase involved in cell wall biosynthesis
VKIHVLHITFDMRIGGTEQVIKNLIEERDKSRLDMSIFCLEEPIGPFGQMLIEQGISINSVQRKQGFDISLIKLIRKYIIQNKIDVLHCHQYTPWVYGTLASIGTGKKVIFTEHGRFYPDRSSWKRRYINPVLTRLTDHISAISQATKQALIDYEFIPEDRIHIIYNGIQPLIADKKQSATLKSELGIPDASAILGTIARLDPIKNHQMMLAAFKLVLEHHPDCYLIIVGDGEERNRLEATSDSLGIKDKVIFTGYIEKPVNLLEAMDIFLLSSLSEGTSMTLLEAMSLKKSCVVTNAGGNSEIILDGVNGIVTENDNAEEFSNGIKTLLDDQSLRQQMQENAFDRFNNKFTAQKMLQNYESLYQQ